MPVSPELSWKVALIPRPKSYFFSIDQFLGVTKIGKRKLTQEAWVRIFICIILLSSLSVLVAKNFTVSNIAQLYAALASAEKELQITLLPGIYDLRPISVTDSTLGNAVNPDSMITVTAGLHLTYQNISLVGKDRAQVIIKTHAGYGIFIEHCLQVSLKNLTISEGIRDQDGNATSGAIVVKHSRAEITGCIIANNQGDYSHTIAGIIGIAGREGAILDIHHNIIRDNSWDGVALYRDSEAIIENNLIYNGRGAGIGITWNAEGYVSHNVIHHYWKGIGSFGTSTAHVIQNLLRDLQGWGIIASGQSTMGCYFNEVRRIGNVGIAIWDSTATMDIKSNVICQTGKDKQWVAPLVGIWSNADSNYVRIESNLFWDNPQADIAYGYKEPGIAGSGFTFAYSGELFNNYKLLPTLTLNSGNYLPPDYREPVWSSLSQPNIPMLAGIFGSPRQTDKWTWDPDKTPFDKLKNR